MEPIRITDMQDPRVAVYRNVRDADLVGRRGVFLAEGELVVKTLLRRHNENGVFRARSVLLNQTRLEAMGDSLEGLGEECPVYFAAQDVMDEIVGFHIHRGVLACGCREEPDSMESIIAGVERSGGPLVVLENLANHDNTGGVFRNAAAFGCTGVLLTERCCDPLYRKALRVSMGHVLSTPYSYVGSVAGTCAVLHEQGWTTVALTPDASAVPLRGWMESLEPDRKIAILLGAEGPGLTSASMDAASVRVRIPIAPGVDSLNVVVAGAIAMSAIHG